jgi:hypothetical protein
MVLGRVDCHSAESVRPGGSARPSIPDDVGSWEGGKPGKHQEAAVRFVHLLSNLSEEGMTAPLIEDDAFWPETRVWNSQLLLLAADQSVVGGFFAKLHSLLLL